MDQPTFTDLEIETCARAAHEANRVYCLAHGDESQPPWSEAPAWQRESALLGVRGVVAGNGPRESHESWTAEKLRTGWTYGPVKDPVAKTHPCLVPYDALPPEQRAKDALFIGTVKAMLGALEGAAGHASALRLLNTLDALAAAVAVLDSVLAPDFPLPLDPEERATSVKLLENVTRAGEQLTKLLKGGA